MSQLLSIETAFLSLPQVKQGLNLSEIRSVQRTITNAKKKKFEQTLALSKLVTQAVDWFQSPDGQRVCTDEGISWSNEEIGQKVFGWQKSFAYKMAKVGKLQEDSPQVVTKFKKLCTQAENNGEDANRSVEGLLKFAKAETNGEEQEEVTREKTYATFSIAKDGLNGESGFSIRLTKNGIVMSGDIEDDNIQYNVAKLFGKLERILRSN